jgi:hypothetical protein
MSAALVETVRRIVNADGKRVVQVSATETTKVVTISSPAGEILVQMDDRQARALAEALLSAASEAA